MTSIYVKAFLLTCLIFSVGLGIGWWLDQTRLDVARTEIEELKIQADEARLGFLYYNTFKDSASFCPIFESELEKQIENVGSLGERLELLRQANKLDTSFYRVKKQYVLFNTELWMHSLNYQRACEEADVATILYFYPEHAACERCYDQARVLSELKLACPEKAWVFALPTDLETGVIHALLAQYGVTQTPALVVNGEKVFNGFASKQEIKNAALALAGC